MCSYNLVNGEQVSHNKRYLTDILRDEWGFDGYVMSDWGAVADRVRGVEAGLDLEMPSSNGAYDSSVTDAVNSGELDIKAVDAAVERILNIVYKYYENHEKNAVYDKEKHHDIARGVAEEKRRSPAHCRRYADRFDRSLCEETALSGRRQLAYQQL